jgi:Fe-S-cluster containining protein
MPVSHGPPRPWRNPIMRPMETLPETVHQAAISQAVAAILAQADADIAARRPVCRASGNCCQFETYGHRLFVTTAELLHFVRVHGTTPSDPNAGHATRIRSLHQLTPTPEGCPYQVEGLCTARDARPLGCRVYFCDVNAQSWQNQVYETYHARLQAVHESLGLPYRYLEWRQALREAGLRPG